MERTSQDVLDTVIIKLGASSILNVEKIQTLWSGYGGIFRLQLKSYLSESVIVKLIDLQDSKNHLRGWATNNSHQRKVKSYEVEQAFYQHYASRLKGVAKVADVLFTEAKGITKVIVLEDLSIEYPVLKQSCTYKELLTVIKWLARFHAKFIGTLPQNLWPIGSYWHLETRPDELKAMQPSLLKENAEAIDAALNNAKFKTIIHGDAKVANFCFSESGDKVAAVDFQYVGGGVGVKDVAYFLGSCLTSDECALYEEEVLNVYFDKLLKHVDLESQDKEALEKEWRSLYPLAWADFNRFLLGWMPEHRKLHTFALSKNKKALEFLKS